MGDRCSLTMSFLQRDSEIVDNVCGLDWAIDDSDQEKPVVREFTWDEANYAMGDELRQLAKQKLSFYGSHDAGGSYGPEEFVCYRGDYVEIEVGDEGPVVSVSDKGVPSKIGLARVKKYRRLLRLVEREFEKARRERLVDANEEGEEQT